MRGPDSGDRSRHIVKTGARRSPLEDRVEGCEPAHACLGVVLIAPGANPCLRADGVPVTAFVSKVRGPLVFESAVRTLPDAEEAAPTIAATARRTRRSLEEPR